MRRADRLFALVQALRGGRVRTAAWLGARLEVSPRTIYRDIADLQAHGAPIEGERGMGYLLRNEYFLPPLALTPAEREALAWAVALVATHADDAMAGAGREVLAKLGVPAAAFHAPPSLAQAERLRLGAVRAALAQCLRLHIRYRDATEAPTTRAVRPLSLEHWGKVWTLTAWCELRGAFRVFRLDRISEAVPGARFENERGRRIEDYLATLSCKAGHGFAADR